MSTEDFETHYEAVLDDLRERRQALDVAIAAIERILDGQGAPRASGAANGSTQAGDSETIRSDTFFHLSVRDGVTKYLRMKKRPQSARAIADALEEGGMISSAKNFYSTVYTGLRRMADAGLAVQLDNKNWGLAEWYPSKPRSSGRTRNGETDDGTNSDSRNENGGGSDETPE